MSLDNWKLENDLCRCCHAEGIFKNLGVRFYNELGEEEIYSDMIRDNLGIDLTPVEGLLCEVTFKICDQCVLRLRDVTCFKRQVQSCEEKFRDMYSRNVFKVVEPFSGEIKVEPEIDVMKIEENADDGFDARFSDEEDDKALIEQKIKNEELRKTRSKGKTKAKAKPKEHVKKERVAKQKKNCQVKKKESVAEDGNVPVKKKGDKRLRKLLSTDFTETIENGLTKFYCLRCDATFTNKRTLDRHVQVKHACSMCTETFNDFDNKINHEKTAHGKENSTGKFICDTCRKEYPSRNKIADHLRRTHKDYKCKVCGEILPTLSRFIRHKFLAHNGPRFECGICDYVSEKKNVIESHQRRVHLKEKTIKCTVCDMKFFCQPNLKYHMIKHKKAKIHTCKFCGKKYPRKVTLTIHQRIHTGEKRKVCKFCDEAFVQKSSLNYHMLRHHPEKV